MSGYSSLSEVCSKCNGPKDKRSKHCFNCREPRVSNAEHGDVRRYDRGCRCDLCRRANADRAAQRKRDKPEQVRLEKYNWAARNRDRINERRRKNKEDKRKSATASVKRRYRSLGVLIDRVVDDPISQYLVYALVDPTDLKVRYVGKSSSGLERPKQHGLPSVLACNYNKRKDDWIKGLQEQGLYYAIRVLEYVDIPEQLSVAEPYWIQWFRSSGEHIYNLTDGDDTQIRVSEETKRKMSERMKGRVITWGDKISAAKKGKGNFRHKRKLIAKNMP